MTRSNISAWIILTRNELFLPVFFPSGRWTKWEPASKLAKQSVSTLASQLIPSRKVIYDFIPFARACIAVTDQFDLNTYNFCSYLLKTRQWTKKNFSLFLQRSPFFCLVLFVFYKKNGCSSRITWQVYPISEDFHWTLKLSHKWLLATYSSELYRV